MIFDEEEIDRLKGESITQNKMFDKYIDALNKFEHLPSRIGFKFDVNRIYVFAINKDDDKGAICALIESEASIINEFFTIGFYMTTTFVEESDKYNIPKEYTEIKINK